MIMLMQGTGKKESSTTPAQCGSDTTCLNCINTPTTCWYSNLDNVWWERGYGYANEVCSIQTFLNNPFQTEQQCLGTTACSLSNPDNCPQIGPACMTKDGIPNRWLCRDAFTYNGASYCDISNFFDCVGAGYNSCMDNKCLSNIVCNAGFEVCSNGIDFNNPFNNGDVYKCKADGAGWSLIDDCSSSEHCQEFTADTAQCRSDTTPCINGKYYCTHDTPNSANKGLVAICDQGGTHFTIFGQCPDMTCAILEPLYGNSATEVCGEEVLVTCGDGLCGLNENNCAIDCGDASPPTGTPDTPKDSFDFSKILPWIIGGAALMIGLKMMNRKESK